MNGLDHLWAGWRGEYVASVAGDAEVDHGEPACVFCRVLSSEASAEERLVVWEGDATVAVLNLYPYTTGHLMVLPRRHVAGLGDLLADEAAALWATVTDAVATITAVYSPEGLNLGANLGRAAGAGIPGHVHVHVLPRWGGDTNFMTSVADTRVMPEPMGVTWRKLSEGWVTH